MQFDGIIYLSGCMILDPTSSGTFRDVVRVSMKSSDSEIASSVIFGSGGRGWPDVRIARINYCTNWRKVRSQMQ